MHTIQKVSPQTASKDSMKTIPHMKIHFLLLSTLFLSFSNSAHDPELSSTLLVERNDGTWVLQIRAALTAFEYEVHTHYGKDQYATPEEFNALVVRHLMEKISITFNEKTAATLQNGYVKLGHETMAVFDMNGVPKKINKVMVSNTSFKDIHDSQSALVILKKGLNKQQFWLNTDNEHTARLKASRNQFELQ